MNLTAVNELISSLNEEQAEVAAAGPGSYAVVGVPGCLAG